MSLENYPNPLDNFRSFSYHYVLSVANTTTAFESMLGGGSGEAPYLASVLKAQHPGAAFSVASGGTAWLIADTRRFSAYQITKVEMEHIYGTGSPHNPSVPTSLLSMTLVDSTGMSFINMLMDLFHNKIKSTRSSAFFMLSIIFVGHDESGATHTISRTNIPLILLAMDFTVDHRGSVYNLEFFEQDCGPQRGSALEIVNSLGGALSISAEPTVGAMVQKLEDQLNIASVDFYKKFTNEAYSKGASGSLGKLVQYMFTVPEEWKGFRCNVAGRDKHREQMFIAATSAAKSEDEIRAKADAIRVEKSGTKTQMSFSDTTTIPDAIRAILESSLDVLDLASEEKRKQGLAQTFKVIMNITSDESTYVVHADVFPYRYPKLADNGVQPGASNGNIDGANMKNLITYNYLFSGLNKDVLDMKIHYLPESAVALDTAVDIGQSRFATNAAYGQTRSGAAQAALQPSSSETKISMPDLKSGDPIFFAMKTKDQRNNVNSQRTEELGREQAVEAFKKKQEYASTIAQFHFLSSIDTDITIRGNPNIIEKYADRGTRGGIPPHPEFISSNDLPAINSAQSGESAFENIIEQRLASAKSRYYGSYVKPRIDMVPRGPASDTLLSGPDISVSPIFCKINMFAPNIDYTTSDFQGAGPRYTDEFFYKGPYMVMTVKTVMEGGDFTHTLNLIPYDVSGVGAGLGADYQPVSRQG